jgi:catechol 2,3-dioxygenase-like lactoylglutathione lyase family enzyme
MWFPVTTVRLAVQSADSSVAFYEALLGVRASRAEAGRMLFDVTPLRLALTIEPRVTARTLGSKSDPPLTKPRARFTLYVIEPHRVGAIAIALRHARIPLRLADRGLRTQDPDGNEWAVVLRTTADCETVEQESSTANAGHGR